MTRLEEARERCMDALDAWAGYAAMALDSPNAWEADLIDAYAALKRAQNGDVEDDHT